MNEKWKFGLVLAYYALLSYSACYVKTSIAGRTSSNY
jgi:hypothetical protein